MTVEPVVSVCMPLYNTERYLAEAIEGVLRQTHRNFELIICDNRSTDKSVEIAEEYAQADRRIRLVRNRRNLGYAGNLHKVLSLAQGNYMIVHCADDFVAPDAIAKLVAIAQAAPNPARVLVISDHWTVDENSRPLYVNVKSDTGIEYVRTSPVGYAPTGAVHRHQAERLLSEALRRLQIVGFQGASLYSRALFEEIEGLYSGLLYSPDAHLNYLLLDRNPDVFWLHEAHVSWRWAPGNQASLAARQAIPKQALDVYLITHLFSNGRLQELGLTRDKITAQFVDVYCARRAWSEIKNGSALFAFRHCLLGISLYPREALRNWRIYVGIVGALLGPIGKAGARWVARNERTNVVCG